MAQDPAAGATWRTSSYSGSGGNECVEICLDADGVRIRDSKDRGGGELRVSSLAWAAFIDAVKQGGFDRRS